MVGIEEWLKPIILSLEGLSSKPADEADAERKINELQSILNQLEDKEKTVREIHVDCEQYGAQYGDVQNYVKQLLLGLTSNIQVIRENQICIRTYLESIKNAPKEIPQEVVEEKPVIVEAPVVAAPVEAVKPETQAMSTQTITEHSTDNIMVIQSMNSEGETIQIYNMPSSHEEGKESDRNVIVEAKYVRSHSGEPKRASELVLKNVPANFETTFVEPDETTTEIIVDPDGSKRIIVRKLTKTTQQIVKSEEYDGGALPAHIRAQLGLSGTTHDVIVGSPDQSSFEQHAGITESTLHAVIEHVTHKVIRKTRKIVKKIVIIDGEEHVTEEVIEEPDEIEEFSEDRPAIEYEISDAQFAPPGVEEIVIRTEEVVTEKIEEPMIEIVEKLEEKVPEVEKTPEVIEKLPEVVEEIKPEPEVASKVVEETTTDVEIQPEPVIEPTIVAEKVKQPEPAAAEPETVSEGENQSDQVLETITEARVELIASEVDNLAPVEDIKVIWPYATPHITSQSTKTEIQELPASTPRDSDTQEIWPNNSATGSNFDLDEYSFDRTLEKSSDYLDNDSFIPVDAGLETSTLEPSRQDIYERQETVIVSDVHEEKLPEPVETKVVVEEKTVDLPQQPEKIVEPVTIEEVVEKVKEIPVEDILVKESEIPIPQEPSAPLEIVVDDKLVTPPLLSPRQMATITIVKTMTFLEQEKINAEATMFVTTEPIQEQPLDVSQLDRSIGEVFVERIQTTDLDEDFQAPLTAEELLVDEQKRLEEQAELERKLQEDLETAKEKLVEEQIAKAEKKLSKRLGQVSVDVVDNLNAAQTDMFIQNEIAEALPILKPTEPEVIEVVTTETVIQQEEPKPEPEVQVNF